MTLKHPTAIIRRSLCLISCCAIAACGDPSGLSGSLPSIEITATRTLYSPAGVEGWARLDLAFEVANNSAIDVKLPVCNFSIVNATDPTHKTEIFQGDCFIEGSEIGPLVPASGRHELEFTTTVESRLLAPDAFYTISFPVVEGPKFLFARRHTSAPFQLNQ
jgi:hypothetical protein